MVSARFGRFRIDMGGVRQVLKSGPVESLLKSKAESMASECNSRCYADRGNKGHEIVSDKAPFHGWTSKGGYTALGHVSTVNLEGIRFQSKSKVIDSMNH